jgi:hypothetical protein
MVLTELNFSLHDQPDTVATESRIAMAEEVYMMEPPKGQDRWEAGSAATIQIILGACLFTLGTVVYGLRILTRVRLLKNPLRLDDCRFMLSHRGSSIANLYSVLTGASLIACWAFYACTMGSKSSHSCQHLHANKDSGCPRRLCHQLLAGYSIAIRIIAQSTFLNSPIRLRDD